MADQHDDPKSIVFKSPTRVDPRTGLADHKATSFSNNPARLKAPHNITPDADGNAGFHGGNGSHSQFPKAEQAARNQ